MHGIYLPPNTYPHVKGRYTVCLYDTKAEAEDDLPRVQRKHGQAAYVGESR